jgi:hypothetical protein
MSSFHNMAHNSDRVKYAIQHYVNDDHHAGLEAEGALVRAQQLLLSYVMLVFSEDDLSHMKQQ